MTDKIDRYEAIRREGQRAIRTGNAASDLRLDDKGADLRRGMTLVLRPDAEAARRIDGVLAELRDLEPEQYFYAPAEYHITFLSLFPATPDYHRPLQLDAYWSAIAKILSPIGPFILALRGLAATAEAVLVQGLAEENALNRARDQFRERFPAERLSHQIDARYRIETAHLTIMRFRRPFRDAVRFADRLEGLRDVPLGTLRIKAVEWVENDWYLSSEKTDLLHRFPLGSQQKGRRSFKRRPGEPEKLRGNRLA